MSITTRLLLMRGGLGEGSSEGLKLVMSRLRSDHEQGLVLGNNWGIPAIFPLKWKWPKENNKGHLKSDAHNCVVFFLLA